MSRPQTKADLVEAANITYDKLLEMIASMTEKELSTPFDFSGDVKKKEKHWQRDKNVRDILVHLSEWHKLTLNWIEKNKQGIKRPFLLEGYNWKTYGDMNMVFWENCQNLSFEQAMEQFKTTHQLIIKEIEKMSNEELFTSSAFDWTGNSAIESYFVSNTSSHYEWAMKKIKAHKKQLA